MNRRWWVGASVAAVLAAAGVLVMPASSAAQVGSSRGKLSDGAAYRIDIPYKYNGTVLVYSHGLVPPGQPDQPELAPDETTATALLARGYALAGTAYGSGYAVEAAVREQTELAGIARLGLGGTSRVVAWGSSQGGLISLALAERTASGFDGALSACGIDAGTVGLWDTYLDTMLVIKTLIAPDLTLVHDRDPAGTRDRLLAALNQAQTTPQGQARIALAAAMTGMPGWSGAGTPRPDAGDDGAAESAQLSYLTDLVGTMMTLGRADVEQHAGGNPSSNTRIDYAKQLKWSTDRDEVQRLYAAAGLDLTADLHRLAKAPRVHADSSARRYANRFATPSGRLHGRPVVTLHGTGDGAVAPEHEDAYRRAVTRSGNGTLLQQFFVDRAGHCTFTPAELVTAVDVLDQRLRSGRPEPVSTSELVSRATKLGPDLNGVRIDGQFIPVAPGFVDRSAGVFLRDVSSHPGMHRSAVPTGDRRARVQ